MGIVDVAHGKLLRLILVVVIGLAQATAGTGVALAAGKAQGNPWGEQTMGLDKLYDAPEIFGYGVTVQLLDQPVNPLLNGVVAMRFNWVRQSVNWESVEPSAGTYYWDELDALVQSVKVRGLHLLLVIEGTPAWARPNGADLNCDGPPADLDDLGEFVSVLAKRYTGEVDAYQIWQEPNHLQHWQVPGGVPNAQDYVRLLGEAYLAVKTESPEAMVVSAGLYPSVEAQSMMSVDDLGFLAEMYQGGAALWMDVLGVHLNGVNLTSREYIAAVSQIQSRYAEKPIWLTQVGWACAADSGRAQSCEEQQAAYLVEAFRMAEELPAIEALIVDNFNLSVVAPADPEADYSLMRADWSARPAFVQLAQMRQHQVFTLDRLRHPWGHNRAPQSGPKPHQLQALALGWGG